MTGLIEKKTVRPEGAVRIISPINSSFIVRPEDSKDDCYYRYQEYYALALWALQEKFGLTFEEATFRCCIMFRLCERLEFIEKVFGMNFDEYGRWDDYLRDAAPGEKLAEYIGEFEHNLFESDVNQWF